MHAQRLSRISAHASRGWAETAHPVRMLELAARKSALAKGHERHIVAPDLRFRVAERRLPPMLGKTSGQLRLLTRALDVLEEPVLLFDALGRVMFVNDAVAVWLGEDSPSESLRAEVAELGRALVHQLHPSRMARRDSTSAAMNAWVGASARRPIRLLGRCVAMSDCDGEYVVLVTLHERMPSPLARRICQNFHLTDRECRVARLLADRRSNMEIACELRISPHTARHHTEIVLGKLGGHSRRDVAFVLDRARELGDGDQSPQSTL